MGFGDVKLAGVLGMYLGLFGVGSLVVGGFGAFVVGGVIAGVLWMRGKVNRKSGIPFGPSMIIGASIGVVWGPSLWRGYLDLML